MASNSNPILIMLLAISLHMTEQMCSEWRLIFLINLFPLIPDVSECMDVGLFLLVDMHNDLRDGFGSE